jgi:hypothetical protein
MLLKQTTALLVGIFVLSAPCSGRADIVSDIIGFPVKALLGSTVDKVQGSADEVVDRANTDVTGQTTRIAELANALVTHTNHDLEARILQIKTSADDSVNLALSHVQGVGDEFIDRFGDKARQLIAQANADVLSDLNKADSIVQQRTADINKLLEDRTTQIDHAVADRIAQADEVVGRRLGDVDVIAAEQRIALESTIIRVAVMIGVIAFIVFVLRTLWLRYDELTNDEASKTELAEKRGARRTGFLFQKLMPALVAPTLAAFCGVAILGALYQWLPSGALQEAAQLTTTHQLQLADAVRRIDYPHARFEASHLGYLDDAHASFYEGQADKTGLVRDFIQRPGLVTTPAGLTAFMQRLSAAERLLGPGADSDLLTLRAMLAWKTGSTRRAEHEAASLAARALGLSPNGFGLSPLARAYVETFLSQPYIAPDSGEGRDAASMDELGNAIALAAPDRADSPLAGLAELAQLMRALEVKSSEDYVQMAEANAAVVAAKDKGDAAALATQLQARASAAALVIAAWKDFDDKLQASDDIKGRLLLTVFGLNDALLSRALWFAQHRTSTANHGTRIAEESRPIERAELAPARIAWTRRYGDLLSDPARQVFEAKEAQQFQSWERWAIELEDALIAHAEVPTVDEAAARWRVVIAAAALGLYVEGPQYRVAYAQKMAGGLTVAPPPPANKAASAKKTADKSTNATKTADQSPLVPIVTDAPSNLNDLLGTRGQRLI